jgi:transcriptional regulator with XRE-family HTH domain
MAETKTSVEKKSEMNSEKKFASVSQMADAISGGDQIAESVKKRIEQRQVVKTLLAMRSAMGVPQAKVAKALNSTQSRVSKLENGFDGALCLGELEAYARTLERDVCISLIPRNATAVDRVKMHAFQIKRELEQMAEFAHKDEGIAEAVAGFFGEAFFNLVNFVQAACGKLPKRSNDEPYIHIGCIEFVADEDCEETQTPRGISRRMQMRPVSVHTVE